MGGHISLILRPHGMGTGTAGDRPKQGPLKLRAGVWIVGQECVKEISILSQLPFFDTSLFT